MMSSQSTATSGISLPKGGGALKGIGESFEASSFSGTGNYTVPVAISPGRAGFQPALTLRYTSAGGNGAFGLGWDLAVPRIARKIDKGIPTYDDDLDTFTLDGTDELVPALAKVTAPGGTATWVPEPEVAHPQHTSRRYRPRTETFQGRIERWQHDVTGAVHWRTISRDNVTSLYGSTAHSRISDPDDPGRVYAWLLSETFDPTGNHIRYEYARDDPELFADHGAQSDVPIFESNSRAAQVYLRRIYYGNLPDPLVDESGTAVTYPDGSAVGHSRGGRRYAYEVLLDYGDWAAPTVDPHPDPPADGVQELFGTPSTTSTELTAVPLREDRFSSHRSGFELRTARRCHRILMFHHFAELGAPTLVRSTNLDYDDDPDTGISLLAGVTVAGHRRAGSSYDTAAMPPVTFEYSRFRPTEQRYQSLRARGDDLPPLGLDDPDMALIDLFGDGLPDVLHGSRDGYRYWRNLGDGWLDRPRSLDGVPAGQGLSDPGVAIGDLAGDGKADLLLLTGALPGFLEATTTGAWHGFTPFGLRPTFDVDDPNLRLLDLTGNGVSDALLTAGDAFIWFEGLGEDGFAPPRAVPRIADLDEFPDLYFDDPAGRVRLADMTGDGLSDIVLLHNRRIDYWPNLGYGRFGRRVTMGNAPRLDDRFAPAMLFLADVSGTGCADLVYVDVDRVHLWFNRSGNEWSDTVTIAGTPMTTSAQSVTFADIFGTGTAALVWSDDYDALTGSGYKALDFCGGIKPYVLTAMDNNAGVRTTVSYSPSTRYFLTDLAAGEPWATNLPFPVQLVDRVEVADAVAGNTLVTTYKYHHGYYDGIDREFRGFGRVDQFDAETYDDSSGSAPVETRSWFHTGLYVDPHPDQAASSGLFGIDELTTAFSAEYFSDDAAAAPLEQHDVDLGDSPHDGYRALRGSLLRSEVYGRDNSSRADRPYVVTDHRYRVVQLQPGSEHHHEVHLTHGLETVTAHYERDSDPRIGHTLTLRVDEFGNPLTSVFVGYGRTLADSDLSPQDQTSQMTNQLTLSEYRLTNAIDDTDAYRLPQPAESRSYELSGFQPQNGTRFTIAEFSDGGFAALAAAVEIGYETTPTPGIPQKRLIERVRTRYRPDDLTGLLPLGAVEPRALPGITERLAFTPELLTQLYAGRVTESMLLSDGGYVHSDGDPSYWAPSGRVRYSPGDGDSPATELAAARQRFFLPQRTVDPFGASSYIQYDHYGLLVRSTTDALDNQTTVTYDYRTLQPEVMTDPNGNQIAAAYDVRGIMVGTAVLGKPGSASGDGFAGFQTDLPAATVDDFLSQQAGNAAALLGNATTRLVYDLDRYARTGRPAFVAHLARAQHTNDSTPVDPPVHTTVTYCDGFGREIQRKVQAEPGPVGTSGTIADPRWVATGWVELNNKGKPVREYEPFFDDGLEYRGAVASGVFSSLVYDPLGRTVATLHPDHTWEKVVLGPWRQEAWDVNDTVLIDDPAADPDVGAYLARLDPATYLPTWFAQRSTGALGEAERVAAVQASVHAGTPAVSYGDTLGRNFLSTVHNRVDAAGPDERYRTHIVFDIEGNQRALIDAVGRIALRAGFDMLGNRVYQQSMEAGERWTLEDVSKQPIFGWDSRGHRTRTTYDVLRRPTAAFVEQGGTERMVGRTSYGEAATDAEARNLRGRVVEVCDQAGVLTNAEYDFKGNPTQTVRQFATEYRDELDWSSAVPLEPEVFASTQRYDALGRDRERQLPDGTLLRPTYNAANYVERIDAQLNGSATTTSFVTGAEYNPRGQWTVLEYANGLTVSATHDPLTFRLRRLRTVRAGDHALLQDLSYHYDPAGNITAINDGAQQTIFFDNQVVTPENTYVYDAVYRLVEATGREHVGTGGSSETTWNDSGRTGLAHPSDGGAMRRYTERYEYDAAGNILRLRHLAGAQGTWNRGYEYGEPSLTEPSSHSNRLTRTVVGNGAGEPYQYDAHGNIITMPHVVGYGWDFADRLKQSDLGVGNVVHYVYNAAGERIRKVVEKDGVVTAQRFYLGSLEIFRRQAPAGTIALERHTVLVEHDDDPIAQADSVRIEAGSPVDTEPFIRYLLGNHLGSVALEVDAAALVIGYEEYYPYGSTSYQSVRQERAPPKRHRFTGRERDDETGLGYHTHRYYAPWLGRWISCDPVGVEAGLNLYVYCFDNPIGLTDPLGTDPPADAVSKSTYKDGKFVTTQQIQREGMHSALVTTLDVASGQVTQRLYRRDDGANRHWTDVTDQAMRSGDYLNPRGTPKGTLSVEWNMPSLKTDLEKIRDIKSPGLLYGFMPFHTRLYLKDQTIGIRNPYLRMQASAMQQSMRAVDKVNADLIEFAVTTLAGEGPALVRGIKSFFQGAKLVNRASPGVHVAGEAVEGLADQAVAAAPSLASARTDGVFRAAAGQVTGKSGRFDIVVHSDGMTFWVRTGPYNSHWAKVPPSRVADFMRANGYTGGPVRLIACSSGACSKGAAQKLANELGAAVKAPTDTVWIHPGGRLTVGPTPTSRTGSWVWFGPKKK